MKLEGIRSIADAVLYEGYILYPYRASSIKNQRRWTFGGIFPRAFGRTEGDSDSMQTQVLVEGTSDATIDIHVRFLHLCAREVGTLAAPIAVWPEQGEPQVTPVACLEIDDHQYQPWEEAVEREIAAPALSLRRLAAGPVCLPFSFRRERQLEPIRNRNGEIVAAFVRTTLPIRGAVTIAAEQMTTRDDGGLARLTVVIENVSAMPPNECRMRQQAQRYAFASTHTILSVEGGAFVSLLDPPAVWREAAVQCENRGTWPVLAGPEGERGTMLSSPIILYDYPKIAPESAGDLFDGTEIDEILTLRILAMTDSEKREMASVDTRARALLERTHAMTPRKLDQLHGTFRSGNSRTGSTANPDHTQTRPGRLASLLDDGPGFAPGSRVRLCPRPRGDVMDLVLKDQIAVVEAVERDFEDRVHVAVTLLDDPGRDLGRAGFPGHRFYFAQDEVVPLGSGGEP
jgi:hypothetical protein